MYSPRHIRNCLRLIDMFSYRLHNCLVFPLLGTSLDAFLKKNNNRRFPRVHIKHIAYQLLKSVSCTCRVCFRFRKQVTNGLLVLHKYSIVHTDLKPDNIMIIDDRVCHPCICSVDDIVIKCKGSVSGSVSQNRDKLTFRVRLKFKKYVNSSSSITALGLSTILSSLSTLNR